MSDNPPTGKRKIGRPHRIPYTQARQRILSLAHLGWSHEQMAKNLGLSVRQLRRYFETDLDLRNRCLEIRADGARKIDQSTYDAATGAKPKLSACQHMLNLYERERERFIAAHRHARNR